MGFKRTPKKEKCKRLVFGKINRKERVKAVPPSLKVQIGTAIIALRLSVVWSHTLQQEVTRWIRDNYGFVNPETVQRRWREMIDKKDVVVEKKRVDGKMRYTILSVGNVVIDPKQKTLF